MSQCTTTQDVLVKLEQAVERGDVPYLHALLINQNLTGEIVGFFNGSQTLLHRACIYGAHECVIALLTLGANPNAVDENKSTPLHLGASRGARALTFLAGHLQLRVLRALQEATRRDPRRVAREYVSKASFSGSGDTLKAPG